MKILAPFNRKEYLSLMTESGVGEFFMGFSDEAWHEKYGSFSDINRLTLFKDRANRYDIGSVEMIADEIHATGNNLYITLNAPGYIDSQLPHIDDFLKILASYKVDGIITGVLELIPMIKRHGMKAVASTMCGVTNSRTARLYMEAGVDRIIFPREVTLSEIYHVMCAVPDVEYEVFIMRNGCRYNDANCLGLHGGKCGGICNSVRQGKFNYESHVRDDDSFLYYVHDTINRYYHEFACGQCALWDLYMMGISAVKIVGRMDSAEDIASDAAITAKNISLAKSCSTREEYLEYMNRPVDSDFCRDGLSCYYPEIVNGYLAYSDTQNMHMKHAAFAAGFR